MQERIAENEELYVEIDEILQKHNEEAQDCGISFCESGNNFHPTLNHLKMLAVSVAVDVSDSENDLPFDTFVFCSAISMNKLSTKLNFSFMKSYM